MKRVLTSIWFLALVLTIPVLVMMPPVFRKYKVELTHVENRAGKGGKVYMLDVQGKGIIERVESFQTEQNSFSFHYYDSQGKLYDQFNFPYSYNSRLSNLFFFDTNEDGLKEVFGFTVKGDSIFMSYIEPYKDNHEFHTFFITTIYTGQRKKLDASVHQIVSYDIDNDSSMELVFSVLVGYNWFPRKIFVFHPETGQVQSSEEFGVHFYNLTPFDYKDDGQTELLCVSSSAKNIPPETDVKYLDDRSRLFVFDQKLKEVCTPLEFPYGIASVVRYFICDESKGEILALFHSYSNDCASTFVRKINLCEKNKEGKTVYLSNDIGKHAYFFRKDEDNFIIFSGLGKIYEFDSDLNVSDSLDLRLKSENNKVMMYDFFEDGRPDFCSLDLFSNVHVFLGNFNDEILIEPQEGDSIIDFIRIPDKNQILVTTRYNLQFYTISYNPFFYLKYPVYVLIYLFVAAFIWIWQQARMRQLQEKYELRNQVRTLRIQIFQNQLNPHFIFNTLNGVASVIKKGDTEKAFNVFMRFSKMVRNILDNFESNFISFEKEMDLVQNFIELQKFRYKELFEYEILIEDKDLNKIQIPRMIVQVHAENAIKHGLIPKGAGGMLKIHASRSEDTLKILVEDNGVGREFSKNMSTVTYGIGLKTLNCLIEEINSENKFKILQNIYDLEDENGMASGTRIEISVPVSLKYSS